MAQPEPEGRTPEAHATGYSCAKKDATPTPETLTASFIKAKKDLLLYPAGNAMVTESIEEFLRLLNDAFPTDGAMELNVEKDRLCVNGSTLGGKDRRVQELCLSLYERGVRRLALEPSISLLEMKNLLETLNLKSEHIAAAGGIRKLFEQRGFSHAAVEETPELTIVDADGLAFSEDLPLGLEALGELHLDDEHPEAWDRLGRLFVRVEKGNIDSIKQLLGLLRNPDLFSGVLEKFSLRLDRNEENFDAVSRGERLLKILNIVGAAIASLPSDDKRAQMFKNLAVSVLGLSSNLQAELVSHGLVPNLALKAIESEILSRFPISQLADVLLEDFQISGGAASMLHTYFANLNLDGGDRSALAGILRKKLDEDGALTTEVDTLLTAEQTGGNASHQSDGAGERPAETGPRLERYPPEKALFQTDERIELRERVRQELREPSAELMLPTVLELLRHEQAPQNHAALVARAAAYLEKFLEERDYDNAAVLLDGLRVEMERKEQQFSSVQLEPLKSTLDSYLGESNIRKLIDTFREMKRESPDFERFVNYLGVVGESAVSALIRTLEHEESRHVRLLVCGALSQMQERVLPHVSRMLDHPTWYVVRNAVSILGQIGSSQCVPHLRKALFHADIRVRKETLKALASINTDAGMELVCECLNQEDAEMSRAALGWIAAMRAEQALPALQRLLSGNKILGMDDESIRLAVEALGGIGTEPAVELLERLSRTRSLLRPRKAVFIRESAAAALSEREEYSRHA